MQAFHCFFQRKTIYINCVHNRIFPKMGRGDALLPPPIRSGGGHGPLAPHRGGPHAIGVSSCDLGGIEGPFTIFNFCKTNNIYQKFWFWVTVCRHEKRKQVSQ